MDTIKVYYIGGESDKITLESEYGVKVELDLLTQKAKIIIDNITVYTDIDNIIKELTDIEEYDLVRKIGNILESFNVIYSNINKDVIYSDHVTLNNFDNYNFYFDKDICSDNIKLIVTDKNNNYITKIKTNTGLKDLKPIKLFKYKDRNPIIKSLICYSEYDKHYNSSDTNFFTVVEHKKIGIIKIVNRINKICLRSINKLIYIFKDNYFT